MQYRLVRLVFLGLVFTFPFAVVLAAPRSPGVRHSFWPLAQVEGMVALGLIFAGQERRRLVAGPVPDERKYATPRPHLRFLPGPIAMSESGPGPC